MAEHLLSPSADCYLAFAHELREKCHKLEHIKGAAKLERKIFAEIKFLKNLLRRSTKVQESHLKSSNLSHFAAIVHAAENLPGTVDILQAFSCPGKNESLIVDVVAGQGHIWVKVIARKAQALHLVWAGQGQFGERDLLRQADDYLKSAQEHLHIYTTPNVYFLFYNNVTFSMAKALRQRGVHVLGHEVPVDADVEHKLNDLHLEVSDDSDDDDDDGDGDGDGDDDDGDGDDEGDGGEGDDDNDKIMSASDYLFNASARNKVASFEENKQTLSSKTTETATSNSLCPSRLSILNQSKPSVDDELCRKAETLGKVGKTVTDSFCVDQRGTEAAAPEPRSDYDSKHSTNPSDSKGGKDSEPGPIFKPCLSEPKGSDGSELKPLSSSDSKLSSPMDAWDSKQAVSEPCGESDSKLSSRLNRKDFDLDSSNPSAKLESKESSRANYKPVAKHSCSANYNLLMGELLGVLPDIRNSVVDTSEDIVNSVSKVNLDITTLITLVSAVTHGHSNFIFKEKILTMQAEEERNTPVLPGLVQFMKGKELFACRSAVEDFKTILATLGGEGEKQRATELMSRVQVIEDNPSHKALQLKNLGKIKDRSKTIFGTGDSLEAITMTANSGFLRACKGQGVSFAVFVHAARALTEDKEKTATPI